MDIFLEKGSSIMQETPHEHNRNLPQLLQCKSPSKFLPVQSSQSHQIPFSPLTLANGSYSAAYRNNEDINLDVFEDLSIRANGVLNDMDRAMKRALRKKEFEIVKGFSLVVERLQKDLDALKEEKRAANVSLQRDIMVSELQRQLVFFREQAGMLNEQLLEKEKECEALHVVLHSSRQEVDTLHAALCKFQKKNNELLQLQLEKQVDKCCKNCEKDKLQSNRRTPCEDGEQQQQQQLLGNRSMVVPRRVSSTMQERRISENERNNNNNNNFSVTHKTNPNVKQRSIPIEDTLHMLHSAQIIRQRSSTAHSYNPRIGTAKNIDNNKSANILVKNMKLMINITTPKTGGYQYHHSNSNTTTNSNLTQMMTPKQQQQSQQQQRQSQQKQQSPFRANSAQENFLSELLAAQIKDPEYKDRLKQKIITQFKEPTTLKDGCKARTVTLL